VEKLYLNEKERLQRKQEKSMRDLAALYKEFEALRRDINSLKTDSNRAIEAERAKFKATLNEVIERIEILEARLRKQEEMDAEIEELKLRLEEVVIENSQKIIQLYKYKYTG
jgi:septal ring factor EnvC (AmiA/AmiB activator)